MKIKDYDIDQYGDDQDNSLINNAEVFDEKEFEPLTIKEIKELQLFINPLDGSVYRFMNGGFVRDTRYQYNSY